MSEDGTAFSADNQGGFINAAGPSPVSYDKAVVVGRPPRDHEPVCFDRAPNTQVATMVHVGSCAAAHLADAFKATFNEQLAGRDLNDAAMDEIMRLADQRAARALKPLPGNQSVPDELLQARSAVAHATMVLLAIEAQDLDEEITEQTLRAILRRQRPTLPR